MNITQLNEVIAAAAKHGLRVGVHRSFNGLTVFNTDDITILYAGKEPSEALEAIQRAVIPQPDRYYTLDEALENAIRTPWVVAQRDATLKVANARGLVLSSHAPDAPDLGLTESNAILAAHCVNQLPRLLAAIRAWQPGQDATAVGQAMVEANRVPGKAVLP